MDVVCRSKDFRLIDVVDAEGFEDLEREGWDTVATRCLKIWSTHLAFNKVAYPGFCHNRYCNSIHDLLDHSWVRHAGNPTLNANIRWDPLECHDSTGASLFCYSCLRVAVSWRLSMLHMLREYLLGIDNVHYHTTFQHLGQASFDGKINGAAIALVCCTVGSR